MERIVAVLVLVSLGIFFVATYHDENREWKIYQRAAFRREYAQKEAALRATLDPAAREKLRGELRAISRRRVAIKQIILPDGITADRCLTCHVEMEGTAESHYRLDGLTFEDVGCTVCHGGDGQATTLKGAHATLPVQAWTRLVLERATTTGRATYVGAQKCKECHEKEYASWMTRKMSRTFEVLNEEEKRTPQCLTCHTTGFGQGGYDPDVPPGTVLASNSEFGLLGSESGRGEKKEEPPRMPDFRGVWCEACHGPGSLYVRIFENGGDAREAREKGGLRLPTARTCVSCHTPEWSPNFSFSGYFRNDALHEVDYWRAAAGQTQGRRRAPKTIDLPTPEERAEGQENDR